MSGIPAWASPGRKVVAVKVAGPNTAAFHYGVPGPKRGQVCTVTKAWWCDRTGEVLLLVAELPIGADLERRGGGWNLSGFKPVVDDKAQERDIALFKHHLKTPEVVE